MSLSASLDDCGLMALALEEAALAVRHADVPVGALVVTGSEIVSCRHNERELRRDPTAHAEILALRDAAERLGTWRLEEATLVVTLEPCAMCAGAAILARVRRMLFGAFDPKAGACGSLYNLCADPRLNHEIDTVGGVCSEKAGTLIQDFFKMRRPVLG